MTSTLLSRRQCGYTKMEIEDPEELQHRKAQFLIYKVLKQATDSPRRTRRRSSWCFRLRIRRLRMKIGKKLKKLKKNMFLGICGAAKCGAQKQVVSSLKTNYWKRLFGVGK